MNLPYVSLETIELVGREMRSGSISDPVKFAQELQRENPHLFGVIAKLYQRNLSFVAEILAVLAILDYQLEADKLSLAMQEE